MSISPRYDVAAKLNKLRVCHRAFGLVYFSVDDLNITLFVFSAAPKRRDMVRVRQFRLQRSPSQSAFELLDLDQLTQISRRDLFAASA